MFVENGTQATELGQCPYGPGTDEWKRWQHQFMDAQTADTTRYLAGASRGAERMKVVKDQVQATRTEANDWHDSVMAEVEEPKYVAIEAAAYRLFHLDDQCRPIANSLPVWSVQRGAIRFWSASDPPDPDPWPDVTPTVSGSGYTAGGPKTRSISGTFTVTDPSMWQAIFGDPWGSSAHWCTGDPVASPRQYRRTRGQTIEERRLAQALSGKPITVRPSAQNHHWEKKR